MLRILILCIFILLTPLSAWSATTPWVKSDYTSVRLLVGSYKGAKVTGGLQFQLRPGWKIYWRTPGDAGLPPALEWKGSHNLKNAKLLFPFPTRHTETIEDQALESYVYTDEILLPITLTAKDARKPLALSAYLSFSACNKVCIPFDASFALNVTPGTEDLTSDALIERYVSRLPRADTNLLPATVTLTGEPPYLLLPLQADNPTDLFVESIPGFRFSQPDFRSNGEVRIPITILHPSFTLATLATKPLRLTLVQKDQAVERKATVHTAPTPTAEPTTSKLFLLMLASAFLGGLILNIMPCVLPVLSLKLLSVLKHTGHTQALIKTGFRITALGIVASFLLLAVITLLLRATGQEVGWGFHFQEPTFLIAVTLIIVLFAYNLIGIFELHLPTSLITRVATLHTHGYLGHFLTGAFATLLATPCVAPFVGTAVSFALTRGTFEIVTIFGMMGIGMAFPYLLFSCFPQWVRLLPKPGPWMLRVRFVLGLLLLGTALWLIWVLAHELTTKAALLLFMLCMLLKFWLQQPRPFIRYPGLFITLILAFVMPLKMPQREAASFAHVNSTWRPFIREKIPELVGNGKVVFVDVTAEWCLLCQVNEIAVLNRADVLRYLSNQSVVTMRADFTNRSPAITRFLEENRRYGIPFNIVYGPGAPKGIILPEILTRENVVAAIRQAQGVQRVSTP